MTRHETVRIECRIIIKRATTPIVVINETTFVKSDSSKGAIKLLGGEDTLYTSDGDGMTEEVEEGRVEEKSHISIII